MKEVEITSIPNLQPGERNRLPLHSFVNILNVLHGELSLLGMRRAGASHEFEGLRSRILEVSARFETEGPGEPIWRDLFRLTERVDATIVAALRRPIASEEDEEIRVSLANLGMVNRILKLRISEARVWTRNPDGWLPHRVDELRGKLLQIFTAIEKHGRGRYQIIYNLALQGRKDYFIDIDIKGLREGVIEMPPVFQDVMRDLAANARKYTLPGGRIILGLVETDAELNLTVEDTGLGIPEDELEKVVGFGERGSNVRHIRTLGDGFGLTKAFMVTKQFGGRMWIASAVNRGTRIRITLPRPETSEADG